MCVSFCTLGSSLWPPRDIAYGQRMMISLKCSSDLFFWRGGGFGGREAGTCRAKAMECPGKSRGHFPLSVSSVMTPCARSL